MIWKNILKKISGNSTNIRSWLMGKGWWYLLLLSALGYFHRENSYLEWVSTIKKKRKEAGGWGGGKKNLPMKNTDFFVFFLCAEVSITNSDLITNSLAMHCRFCLAFQSQCCFTVTVATPSPLSPWCTWPIRHAMTPASHLASPARSFTTSLPLWALTSSPESPWKLCLRSQENLLQKIPQSNKYWYGQLKELLYHPSTVDSCSYLYPPSVWLSSHQCICPPM